MIRKRYATDLSDEEFERLRGLLPAPKERARKPTDPRVIFNALFYLIRSSCQWRMLAEGLSALHHGPEPFLSVAEQTVRRRQEGQGEQAPSGDRYARPAHRLRDHRRR